MDTKPQLHRFIIVDYSESMHCCFSNTILDTLNIIEDYPESETSSPKIMCETFDKESAVLICNALNKYSECT